MQMLSNVDLACLGWLILLMVHLFTTKKSATSPVIGLKINQMSVGRVVQAQDKKCFKRDAEMVLGVTKRSQNVSEKCKNGEGRDVKFQFNSLASFA